MEELIKRLLANDLEALRGLRINGKVPVHPDLINEVIAQVLQPEEAPVKAGPTTESGASASGSPVPNGVDPVALLRRHLRHLEVGVEEGRIVVNFNVQVE